MSDDDLNNVTATPEDVAYESGWHDGCDYGYRLAQRELVCSRCGEAITSSAPG